MKKYLFFATVWICILFAAGCRSDNEPVDASESPSPCLHLSYKADPKSFTSFSETDYKEVLPCDLEYFEVKDVMLHTPDGNTVPLEDALRDGQITLHEIHHLTQKDAESGICYETVESKRGLTRFSYDYISYKLMITNDIYETPDGKQHHIRSLTVTRTGCDPVSIYPELDQEDWGIKFEVAEVSPSGITLNYTQSGGQLIGQLRTGNYSLSRTDIVEYVRRLDDPLMPESQWIEHNTDGTITLGFESLYGPLESGEYLLYLYLHDDYDPEDVPPLVRNYHDMQCYTVEFSIP